jgi:hypothetical protein
LFTKPVSTKNYWAILLESTMCVTKYLVSFIPKINSKALTNLPAVASKCGINVFNGLGGANNSASHIKEYIEGTIERLGFAPDLYYLHRIDPSMLSQLDDGGDLC